MTKKVFWADPYKTELSTTVTSVSGSDITLSETIFFAFSGGQESSRLYHLRMALARDGLQRGQSLKRIASAVGYTPTSLSRALARQG